MVVVLRETRPRGSQRVLLEPGDLGAVRPIGRWRPEKAVGKEVGGVSGGVGFHGLLPEIPRKLRLRRRPSWRRLRKAPFGASSHYAPGDFISVGA